MRLFAYLLAFLLALSCGTSWSIPYFARKYDVDCTMCHSIPPRLNQQGEDFLAAGYRFPSKTPPRRTWPFAVWASSRGQWNMDTEQGRALPNRVEIISGGPIGGGGVFYFVEWLPISQEVGGNNTRVVRHGRFEDLFITLPVRGASLTLGQFRPMTQVDVSRRLSISEPLAFSTGVAGTQAVSGRLTGLRSFSLSGRSPGLRLSHQWQHGRHDADGWYNTVTLPFAGELVIPLTGRVHRERGFEFELRPKGVLMESFYRRGLSHFGGHAFVGNDRRLFGLVGGVNHRSLYSTLALGFAHEISGADDTRVSWETEWIPRKWVALGFRIDDRTGASRPAAYIPHVNFEFPLTTYVVRLTGEHRQQRGNRQWLLEVGTVF